MIPWEGKPIWGMKPGYSRLLANRAPYNPGRMHEVLLNRTARSATRHRLTGCIAEDIGMVIGNWLGWGNTATFAVSRGAGLFLRLRAHHPASRREVESRLIVASIFRRRVALLMIGLLAFAQGSVAFAACSIERGAAAMAMAPDEPCADCAAATSGAAPKYPNLCAAHCTSELQLASAAASIVRGPADLPVLRVARPELGPAPHTALHAPPPGAPPRRILLHSSLI